ncbi:Uncharacterized protein rosmuc_04033 [Roseovarius mucosus DSM 17069]|uniref:Twin-arginine translocation pathway signal n=1 Tax=Roseovarius mucosus DSM 17069 TaxID=1288298 RepID=A0A0A0HHH9_9RHOB|nr:DUF1513 domain-containing protein [Roseovarius mucosus]KGM86159.1 Uncharacterized protein rosmuc_04033 [Roseovarius mucosus DSM 17069]
MTTRRAFIASLLATGATPHLGWAAAGNPAYLAAARDASGSFALHGLDGNGLSLFIIALPARGHAGAGHPIHAEAVAFARRPGTYALVIDCVTGRVRQYLRPPEGRQFNGHGCYDRDGTRLFTAEQESATSAGRVGVWDVAVGYRRIGEFSSGGIGPHEICLLPDGATLAVANGGIATDSTDRTKLNIDTMRPNLSYLDFAGDLLERVELPNNLHHNSIRHLALRDDGLLAFAMQWEGADGAAPPLLGLHRRGGEPLLAEAPLGAEIAMQGYAGSVAFSGDGAQVAITSPRGGRLHRFSPEGRFLGALARADVCGLAPRANGFLLGDGLGGMLALDGSHSEPLAQSSVAWDNHIVAL